MSKYNREACIQDLNSFFPNLKDLVPEKDRYIFWAMLHAAFLEWEEHLLTRNGLDDVLVFHHDHEKNPIIGPEIILSIRGKIVRIYSNKNLAFETYSWRYFWISEIIFVAGRAELQEEVLKMFKDFIKSMSLDELRERVAKRIAAFDSSRFPNSVRDFYFVFCKPHPPYVDWYHYEPWRLRDESRLVGATD